MPQTHELIVAGTKDDDGRVDSHGLCPCLRKVGRLHRLRPAWVFVPSLFPLLFVGNACPEALGGGSGIEVVDLDVAADRDNRLLWGFKGYLGQRCGW
jgi:hypothetical protein